MARWQMLFAAIAAVVVVFPGVIGCGIVISVTDAKAQLTELNVAVAPAVDSAGFFVALCHGLFGTQGLRVHLTPAVSSETEIDQQADQLPMADPVDISCGACPSYLEAQQHWDAGLRPSPEHHGGVAAGCTFSLRTRSCCRERKAYTSCLAARCGA